MNKQYSTDNKYRGIPLVTDKSREYLNPKQEVDYQELRRDIAEFLFTKAKDPDQFEGYSDSVVHTTMNRLDLFFRFVWDQKQRYTTSIGTRTSQLGIEENIGIPDDKRLLHTLALGPTGYGKTQAMLHAALQDAHKGHGLCMVIPKGKAIDQFLQKIPEDRVDDVVYINPADQDTPRINVLEPHTHSGMNQAQKENQKEIIVSDLIDLFKRYSENWGDRFGRVLETLFRAYLDLNIRGKTLYSLLDVFEPSHRPANSLTSSTRPRTPSSANNSSESRRIWEATNSNPYNAASMTS